MVDRRLRNCRILVVEDEYMLAEELSFELHEAGAVVIGPTPSVEGALEAVKVNDRLDCAILDMNLGGKRIDPVADMLTSRGIPFVFVTGYDKPSLPERFAHIVCCGKPIVMNTVVRELDRLIHH